MAKKLEITQHATYTCAFCGKDAVKRKAVGIWSCGSCRKTVAGGAWLVRSVPTSSLPPPFHPLQIHFSSYFGNLGLMSCHSFSPFSTTAAITVRSNIRRLRELQES